MARTFCGPATGISRSAKSDFRDLSVSRICGSRDFGHQEIQFQNLTYLRSTGRPHRHSSSANFYTLRHEPASALIPQVQVTGVR